MYEPSSRRSTTYQQETKSLIHISDYTKTTDNIFKELHDTDKITCNGMPINALCTLLPENRPTNFMEYSPLSKCDYNIIKDTHGDRCIYNIGGRKCHWLQSLSVRTRTPTIRVEEKYRDIVRIKPCKHYLFNQLKEMVVDIPIQNKPKHTNYSLIFQYNFFNRDRSTEYDTMIQANEQDWSTEIKSRILSSPLDFMIYRPTSKGLPLCYLDKNCTVKLEAQYRKSYYDMISMVVLKDDKWVYVEPKDMKQYLQDFDSVIHPWEMVAQYQTMGRDAYERLNQGCTDKYQFWFYNFNTIIQENTSTYGEIVSIPIKDDNPIYGVGWLAEDVYMNSYGSRSTLLQTEEDTIVKSISLLHEKGRYFENMDENYFSTNSPMISGLTLPKDKGIYVYQPSYGMFSSHLESPINELFKNIVLKIQIENRKERKDSIGDLEIVEPTRTSYGSHENRFKIVSVVLNRSHMVFNWNETMERYEIESDYY